MATAILPLAVLTHCCLITAHLRCAVHVLHTKQLNVCDTYLLNLQFASWSCIKYLYILVTTHVNVGSSLTNCWLLSVPSYFIQENSILKQMKSTPSKQKLNYQKYFHGTLANEISRQVTYLEENCRFMMQNMHMKWVKMENKCVGKFAHFCERMGQYFYKTGKLAWVSAQQGKYLSPEHSCHGFGTLADNFSKKKSPYFLHISMDKNIQK